MKPLYPKKWKVTKTDSKGTREDFLEGDAAKITGIEAKAIIAYYALKGIKLKLEPIYE